MVDQVGKRLMDGWLLDQVIIVENKSRMLGHIGSSMNEGGENGLRVGGQPT